MSEYTEAERIERGERATYLLADDLFAEILSTVRLEALNALADVDPSDMTGILRQQAIVAVTGDITDLLKATILATGENTGGIAAQVSPDGEKPTQ